MQHARSPVWGRTRGFVAVLLLIIATGCGSSKSAGPPRDDRQAWRAMLRWSDDCEQAFAAGGRSDAGIEFYALPDGGELIEVACAMGAYQGSQAYFVRDGAEVRPIVFQTYEASGPDGNQLVRRETKELTGSAEFDRQSAELTVWNRYRGPGDCGSYATYEIRRDNARLKEFRAKTACDGKGAEHPEQWPKIPVQ